MEREEGRRRMGVRGERGNREGTAKVKMNGKGHARECGVQTERNMREGRRRGGRSEAENKKKRKA